MKKSYVLMGSIFVFFMVLFFSLWSGFPKEQAGLLATTTLCGMLWMTQAIPIPATSLLPFALLPLFQTLSDKEVATAYGHHMILLLLGGFLLSRSLECSGVHKRFALTMIRMCGLRGPRIVLGFMIASACCVNESSNPGSG